MATHRAQNVLDLIHSDICEIQKILILGTNNFSHLLMITPDMQKFIY